MASNKRRHESEDVENESQGSGKQTKKTRFSDEVEDDIDPNADIVLSEAEVGIVERVAVTNFMCHKKLEVKLGSNVNFIIGRNGSGKSAILTAIIVGLGGKAAVTSRGNSLKSFIKEGCGHCTVAITLRNRGVDAFKSDNYGSSIIVERRLSADGSTSYKLKSEHGKLVSQKKDDLITILDQFNIQIDNPVSILTQDTSRSFLNTSNEKDKYTFFLKATQLEKITDDYQRIIEEKSCTKELLKRKRKVLPDLLNEMKIHKEKYDDMQQLKKMKNQIRELKKELAWAFFAQEKQNLDTAEKQVKKIEARFPSYEKKVNTATEEVKRLETDYEQMTKENNAYKEEVTVLINEKNELSVTARRKREDLKKSQSNCRRVEGDINTLEKDRKTLIDGINEIKNVAEEDLEAERLEREGKLNEKMKEKKQIESQLSVSNHYCHQIDNNIQSKKEKKYQLQNQLRDVGQNIQVSRRKIQDLEANQKNKLAAYGYFTADILKAIDNLDKQNKFHKKPVGPLGSLIELKDKKWPLAVEQCIGGNMSAYACHDSHDMAILKDIFKRVGKGKNYRQPPIILSAFSEYLYDVSKNSPGRGFITVLDALGIGNPVVANSLIDQSGIETVLLIENAKDAQRVMWNEQTRPHSSFRAISKEGHEIIGGRISKYYPSKKKHSRYFQQDLSGSIRDIENELKQMNEQKKQLNEEIQRLDAQIHNDKKEHDKTKQKCMNEQNKINNLQMEIQELQTSDEEAIPDVAAFESDLIDIENKLGIFNTKRDELQATVDEKKQSIQQDNEVVAECAERCRQATEKLEAFEQRQLNLESELKTSKGNRKYYEELLEKLADRLKTESETLAQVKAKYEEAFSQATQYCEQIVTERSVKTIETEIIATQKRIDREESIRGSADDITNNYHAAKKKYETAEKQFKNCRDNLQSIEKAMERRAKRFQDFRKSISTRAKQHFDMLLSQRGYVGKITFDHKSEQLHIKVNVENQKGATVNDSKALSGGERSFSTICFVMALWDAMEAPFRCLDEFDVFMDMLNRKISMNMLMKIAQEQINRQFILLTPQDMSSVTGKNRVRIFRLNDPERGQQTLPFEPVES